MVTRAFPFADDPAPTARQVEAILRDDDTLLAAGAGSGKTTTLVAKIVHLLGAERVEGHRAAKPCELSEIAAITFTNAAAADLRQKLRRAIREVADWHAARGEAAAERQWRERVYEVDRARIGTIHSFCGQLLRELALRVGIDPGFAVLDEAESALLRRDSASAVLRAALAGSPGVADLVDALGLGGAEELIAELAGLGDVIAESLSAWYDGVEPRLDLLRDAATRHRAAFNCGEDEGVWHERTDALGARLAGVALDLAVRTRSEIDARLDGAGALDFDALIGRTRRALREHPEVRTALARRLRWLFVDEFQDTDRGQLEIAYLVTGFAQPERAAAAPRLCIVGDPKQSIYRFRRADVSLWREVERDFAAAGIQPIPLAENFRSRAPILGYVNATFSGLIGAGPAAVVEGGHEVVYVPLEPRRAAPGDIGLVELLASDADEDANADERRLAEAESIVARIGAMIDEREDVVWDDRTGAFRALAWRDVAILFRSRTGLPVFEHVLRRHRVPYYVAGGAGFFGRREVRDVRLLLAALADPFDDVAWMGVLRSPWVGLTDQALLRSRRDSAAAPLSAVLESSQPGPDNDVLARSREWLPAARELRDRVSVAELISFVLERAAYGAQLLAQEGGELALANVRKLVRIAEGRPEATVSEFVAFMEEREQGDARDGDAALYTAGENVVTLTTVHGAKGLEWPVVFLVDLGRELVSERRKPQLIADPAAGCALRITDPDAWDDEEPRESGAWQALYRRELALATAEEKRLWYVGATRARDRLVLCAGASDVVEAEARLAEGAGAERVQHWLLGALSSADGHFTCDDGGTTYLAGEVIPQRREPPPIESAPVPVAAALGAESPAGEPVRARLAPITTSVGLPRRSATSLMEHARTPERRVFARRDGAPLGVAQNVLGDILHGALENLPGDAELDDYLESELVERLGEPRESLRVQSAVQRLRALVEESRSNPAVARLYDAPGAERELAFTWFARSAQGVTLMRGAMDLVALVDGGLEILDYKSHAIAAGAEDATAAAYDAQVAVYVAALWSVTGILPARFSFFFPATGGIVERSMQPAEAEKRVLAMLASDSSVAAQ